MKAAGIVRKVDMLGRIVLPKSLRKRYEMDEGDAVEILVQGDTLVLERYHPKCLFCASAETVGEFKEKPICQTCLSEIVQSR